jgi:hypothetical protein
LSVTETIITFAAGQVLKKVFGPVSVPVWQFHKAHFIVLSRALKESARDQEIQDRIRDVRGGMAAWIEHGRKLLATIPADPEPPSSDLSFLADAIKAAEFQRRCNLFRAGVQEAIAYLEAFAVEADSAHSQLLKTIESIDSGLDNKQMSWAALRTISNATRAMDLNFLRLEMPGLRSVIADVQRRLKQYRQAIGLEDSAKRMPR